jgi:type III restriction enzyme
LPRQDFNGIAIGKAGVEAIEREGAATVILDEANIELPEL